MLPANTITTFVFALYDADSVVRSPCWHYFRADGRMSVYSSVIDTFALGNA